MKKFTLFLSALLISVMSFGADFTLTSANAVTVDGVTITFDQAEGQNAPAWYDDGLRLYAKNTVTISAETNITNITFNWEKRSSKDFAALTANVGAYTHPETTGVGTWTGSAKEVVFTLGDKGQLQLNTLSVSLDGESSGEQPGEDPGEDPGEEPGENPGEEPGENPGEGGSDLWLLVTDASTLSVGDQVVIAAVEADAALSTNQKSNNRGQANVTKSANTLTINEEVQVLTLETGNKANTLALNTGSGYLYAASSSSNYLRTETTLSDNSSWVITISEGVASIVAQGENTRNVMQYNQQNSLFACYGSASQGAIALYKKASAEGVILAPTITGEVNFLDKTTVSITAEEGLKVYYTLDGTEPTNASTEYTAPFELTATTTVKAVAYDGNNASAVVSKTFTKTPLIGCAEANALAEGEIAYMKPFDIVYVVEGTGYIYIKDETGTALIYSYDWDEPTYFAAGDHVEGFIGKSSPYKGLPELKPNVDYNDLTITKGGAASEPTIFAEAPLATDVHKYVQFNGVKFTESATFEEGVASNATMLVGETEVTLRNAFKLGADFVAEKPYNVVGFVAIFNEDIQVYFLSAEALTTAVDNVTIDQNITKFFENGQLIIIKNGVRYNAQGAVVQ